MATKCMVLAKRCVDVDGKQVKQGEVGYFNDEWVKQWLELGYVRPIWEHEEEAPAKKRRVKRMVPKEVSDEPSPFGS